MVGHLHTEKRPDSREGGKVGRGRGEGRRRRMVMVRRRRREKRMQTYPVISSDISAVYNRVSIVMRSSESPVIT